LPCPYYLDIPDIRECVTGEKIGHTMGKFALISFDLRAGEKIKCIKRQSILSLGAAKEQRRGIMNLNELLKRGKTAPTQIVSIGVHAKLVVPPYCTCCMKPTAGRENIHYETAYDRLNIDMPLCPECKAHQNVLKRKRIIQSDLAVLCGVALMSGLLLYTALNAFLAFLISAGVVAAAHFIFGQALQVSDLPAGHSSYEKSVVAVNGTRIAFTSFEYTMQFFGANPGSIPEIKASHGMDMFRLPLLRKVRLTRRYWLISMVMFAVAALILGPGIALSGVRPDSTAAVADATARPAATVSAWPSATVSARPTPTPFNHPALSFPAGTTVYYDKGSKLAPLTIETSANSGQFYYVVLADSSTGEKAIAMYIEAGQTVEIDIPLGRYELYYAAGTVWYGDAYLFGPDGTYSKAVSFLSFTENEMFYHGYTITLYPVSSGDLVTIDVDPGDFPE